MSNSKEDLRFWDVRLVERRIRKGALSRKDYDKHLKALPDSEEKGISLAEANGEPLEQPNA